MGIFNREEINATTQLNEDRLDGIFIGPLGVMFKVITYEQLRTLLRRGEDIVLLNCLSSNEFQQEHIPGSINIPVANIERIAATRLEMDDLIIVYSRSPRCMISAVAADKLRTVGFENVMRFTGGIMEWEAQGLELETTDKAA